MGITDIGDTLRSFARGAFSAAGAVGDEAADEGVEMPACDVDALDLRGGDGTGAVTVYNVDSGDSYSPTDDSAGRDEAIDLRFEVGDRVAIENTGAGVVTLEYQRDLL